MPSEGLLSWSVLLNGSVSNNVKPALSYSGAVRQNKLSLDAIIVYFAFRSFFLMSVFDIYCLIAIETAGVIGAAGVMLAVKSRSES